MTILNIGKASYDITCPIDEYPIEGTKYLLNEKIESGGGTAANVAYLLGKWGETSYFAGVIGSDDYGTKLKKELEQVMVKTELIEVSYEVGTPVSVVLVNKKNGSRTRFDIVSNTQPNLKKYDYSINPDVIFSDGKEYSATINALNKFPRAISIVDAGRVNRDLLELCKFVKYIVCSKGFAESVSGLKIDYNNSASLVNVYKKLKQKYPNNEIIVTLENMGAMYIVNGEIRVMPGIKTQVVDPSGAGDIFHGAFAYCMANGFDMEKAITYSNIAAGLSLNKMGGSPSIPMLKEVISYYNQKFKKEVVIEEAPKVEEVKEEDKLPDIPDAATFKVIDPKDLEAIPTFSIGGASIPAVGVQNVPIASSNENIGSSIPIVTPNNDQNVQ
ncbi:MAG: carbohydrate kinase family protein [Bacilli bacterium]|jgi:sulfofructose kinase|nr:carbohydrate kinase family protein [Bacilli bacterium]